LKGTDKISVSEDAAGNLGTVVLHIGDVTFNGSSDEDGFVQILTDYDLNNLPIGIYTPTLEGNKIDTIVGDSFVLTTVIPKSYNTIAQANAYFNSKLHNQPWPTLDVDKKQQCLNEANIILSRFNCLIFHDTVFSSMQSIWILRQFPMESSLPSAKSLGRWLMGPTPSGKQEACT
jgi:hypothetical protein